MTDAGGAVRRAPRAARRAAPACEFAAVDGQLHFHPDPATTLGVLVVLRSSAMRSPGVYLRDPAWRQWRRAYDLADLPRGRWRRLRGWQGERLAVEVRAGGPGEVAIRWLGTDGRPVAPSAWDRAGMTPVQRAAAQSEHEALLREWASTRHCRRIG